MNAIAFDAAIGNASRAMLDTSTLIAYHNDHETAHPIAEHLLGRIESSADLLKGYCSVVSASELFVRPLRMRASAFTYMHSFLTTFPNLAILPVDLEVAIQAATLRATTNLRTPDALIVATALLAGCECIISNDEAWKRKLSAHFRDFRWIYLADYA